MPQYNAHGGWVSPRNADMAYEIVYGGGRMPAPDDPGWIERRRKSDGSTVRMIRVHGPFDVLQGGAELHCHDGWLALDEAGRPFPVLDDDHQREYEEVT
jgi:hypothetical protein